MKYFAAFLPLKNLNKNIELREQHLYYIEQNRLKGNVFAKGRFINETGGLVIYMAPSLEEAVAIAQKDPYVLEGARGLKIFEWEMESNPVPSL